MDEWIPELLIYIGGIISGAGLKFVWDRSRKDSSRTQTTQIGNQAGGSIAGRDITTRKDSEA